MMATRNGPWGSGRLFRRGKNEEFLWRSQALCLDVLMFSGVKSLASSEWLPQIDA